MTIPNHTVMKNTILKIAVCLLAAFFSSCEDELIMTSIVDVVQRDPVADGMDVTMKLTVTTVDFCIIEGFVELSKNEDLSGSIQVSIPGVELQSTTEGAEYKVSFSNLEPSQTYYYRVVIRGFTGDFEYTGEYGNFNSKVSRYSFKKGSFKSPSVNYTIYTSGMVDMGVSVKWAACNLGADNPAEPGDTSGWGDPTGKLSSSDEEDYGGKYPATDISGSALDIVTAKMGAAYCTPTYLQYLELLEKCAWRYSNYRGATGWLVISDAGKAIFFPCTNTAGRSTRYWTANYNITLNLPVMVAIGPFDNVSEIKGYGDKRYNKGLFRPVSAY